MRRVCIAIVVIIFMLSTNSAFGTTIFVPDDHETIQGGIEAAVDGDSVSVAPGSYFETIDFSGKAISVLSQAGAENTVIDGGQSGVVVSISSAGAVIDGFMISNGYNNGSPSGGGIYCRSGSPTIVNCIISDNYAKNRGGGILCGNSSPTITHCVISGNESEAGGGICCFQGTDPIISNCTIENNSAVFGGGGIQCVESSPLVSNCTISGNTVTDGFGGDGAGIFCDRSTAEISSCLILENHATHDDGGGIFCIDSNPTIMLCTIARNFAESSGGGICIRGVDSPTIRSCDILENSALNGAGIFSSSEAVSIESCQISSNVANNGGGVYLTGSLTSTLTNCTITRNRSGYGGGILCEDVIDLDITHCTIADNTGGFEGGGVSCEASLNITNSILWGNWAPDGPEIIGTSVTVRYSNIGGGWDGVAVFDLTPLHVGDGDYHLTALSPCIDAGIETDVFVDVDGDIRPAGCGVDIGADENTQCWDCDFDHYPAKACGGDDCVDSNEIINPDTEESCYAGNCDDGIDNDCDGNVDTDPECGNQQGDGGCGCGVFATNSRPSVFQLMVIGLVCLLPFGYISILRRIATHYDMLYKIKL